MSCDKYHCNSKKKKDTTRNEVEWKTCDILGCGIKQILPFSLVFVSPCEKIEHKMERKKERMKE